MCTYLLVLACTDFVAGDFLYPPPCERVRFEIGDVRTIRFETDWDEYTIALYQQGREESSARQGPTLIETKDGAGLKSFAWPVKLYDFELVDSESFFFWIFEGDASNQGDLSKFSMASPFFGITRASDPKQDRKDGCVKTKTDPPQISSPFQIPSAATTEEASSKPTASRIGIPSESRLMHPPTTPASPSSDRNLKAEGLKSPGPNFPTHSKGASPGPVDEKSDQGASGMSIDSKIAIGVGAGLGAAALIGCLAFLIFKHSIKGGDRARSMVIWCRGLRASRSTRSPNSNVDG